MKTINGESYLNEITPKYLENECGNSITNYACIHKIRKGSGFSFVDLRTGRYIIQSVYLHELCNASLKEVTEGTYIKFTGTVKQEMRADYGYEITLTDFTVISAPIKEYPINISDNVLNCTLETNLSQRMLSLRHPSQRAILKICEGVTDGFSEYMKKNDFTKIYSPDILSDCCANTAQLFRLKYFDNDAVLADNATYAKQAAVAVYNRVYEVTHAHRADKHNSTRHLNEYIRLDFETAFTDNIYDIMNIQTAMLKYVVEYLKDNYKHELDILGISLPIINNIPAIKFTDAMDMLGKPKTQASLDPTDEAKLSDFAKSEHNCEFIFVTNLPAQKQPFYIMNSKDNPLQSEAFVLLYKGREIAYGGLKIHNYEEQKEKLSHLNIDYNELNEYLDLHRYALPPHGGAGTGLERFAAGLLNLENIKEASLFPRDMHHLTF